MEKTLFGLAALFLTFAPVQASKTQCAYQRVLASPRMNSASLTC